MTDNIYDLICQDDRRRRKLREAKDRLNGLDYVEVSSDGLHLHLYFINALSRHQAVEAANFVIRGGESITDIRILATEPGACDDDPDTDQCLRLTLDKTGDRSTYQLCWVESKDGYPTIKRPRYVDPRFECVSFVFRPDCPTDVDCRAVEVACDQADLPDPDLNYLAKDYASFRQLILDRLALIMPNWKERHVPDLGIALVELLAYTGDYLSYYQDAVATEAYLETARQRISIRRHARLVDYRLHEGCNARAWVTVEVERDLEVDLSDLRFITGANGRLRLPPVPTIPPTAFRDIPLELYEEFHPLAMRDATVKVWQSHNAIRLHTWGDTQCCLPAGATQATLVGQLASLEAAEADVAAHHRALVPTLHLRPGDILIFEEVIGPETGDPDDANPLLRQAVRLTSVEADYDPAYEHSVVHIEWDAADALTFSLCLSAIGPAPDCQLLTDVSLARGNVLLVDHGRYQRREPLGHVGLKRQQVSCEGEGDPTDAIIEVEPLRPKPLLYPGLTFRQAPPTGMAPATSLLSQDPRKALPDIQLVNVRRLAAGVEEFLPTAWQPCLDLLDSSAEDRHYMVEVNNDNRGLIRFGDGRQGKQPQPSDGLLYARYRTGNGPIGNVAADTVSHVLTTINGIRRVRNPLPAQGGTAPETLESVRRFAPGAFMNELTRAITPADYARLAEAYPLDQPAGQRPVQRAVSALRWMGSWYEMLIAVDPYASVRDRTVLFRGIAATLDRYRRIGHDVDVEAARFVPLYIELCVNVLPSYFKGHIKAALVQAFSSQWLPDGQRGFFHPDNLTFGQPIYLSQILATAAAVTGVESVWVRQFRRWYDPAISPDKSRSIQDGLLRIGPMEIAQVESNASNPQRGQIVFDMEGGQ